MAVRIAALDHNHNYGDDYDYDYGNKTMDLEKHETIWGLGAQAGRRSQTGDIDEAWLDAVEKYGTRVFPAAKSHEDDPWFDEYFAVFRDGFESSYT